jgi:hypothetical protein
MALCFNFIKRAADGQESHSRSEPPLRWVAMNFREMQEASDAPQSFVYIGTESPCSSQSRSMLS